MKWKTKPGAYDSIAALQERYNLDLVSAKILSGRGVSTPDAVKFYLEGDISFLHNPFLFEDMELFCDRVLQAVEQKEKVRVFGDRDVDGITSTSLIVLELRRMGLDVSYTVPLGDEPYGVTRDNIQKAIDDGITLAITVDCGISCFEEIDYAQANGLDFLVTDHHIAGEMLPPAYAVIDPKVQGCGYPFENLAGCGVAAKCIWALRLAQTELYKEPVLLLHAYPGNGTVVIEAARLENLVVVDRIIEEVVPGVLPAENSRLLKFLSCNLPVFVLNDRYDEPGQSTEMKQMRKAFPKAEIILNDLRPQFEQYLPAVKSCRSLYELSTKSRFAIYSDVRSELDTLIGLFCAYSRAKFPLLYKEYVPLMDLVAIGTVSDLMPMTDENRILVKTGLKVLETNCRLSMLPFMTMQNLTGQKLSTTDIGWQISPLMNASGRLGRPDVAINMILSEDQMQAYRYAQELQSLNKERQKMGEDAWDRLLPKAKKSYEANGTKLVIVEDNNIARGITGILATRLLKNFKCPCIVLTRTKDGREIGSIRSNDGFNCHEFLSKYQDLFDDFGGHACAGGFSLSPSKLAELSQRIDEDLDYMDCLDALVEDELAVDAVLNGRDVDDNLMKIIERFEPYGEQNPPLQFLVEGARIQTITAMQNSKDPGRAHLRLKIDMGDASRNESIVRTAVFWSAGNRVKKDFDEGSIVDLVFRMGRNYYKGQGLIQLTVQDMRIH